MWGEGEARAHDMKVMTMTTLLHGGNVVVIAAVLPGIIVFSDTCGRGWG